VLIVGGPGWSSLGGHAGSSVVGDDSSFGAFYRSRGGQERGLEGMRPTAMVDLHCIDFGVEGEPGAEMAEGRGGEERRQGLRFLRGGERARLGRG
jgi:hypothetical protein